MKRIFTSMLLSVFLMTPCFPFVAAMGFDEKCEQSDVIVRAVVLKIVPVADQIQSATGEDPLDGDWSGPSSIAVLRVVDLLKGDDKTVDSIIFVPCGYNFDESPCELTESKDYILFLESMGHHYFHPLDPFCMHRVHKGMVGMSGFDWEGDFDPGNKNAESVPLKEFIGRLAQATKNHDQEDGE